MKDYLKYLTQNPSKLALIIAVILFGGLINFVANYTGFNLALSIGVALFSTFVVCLILLQAWGEYMNIEGFWPAVKQFFKS